jgi:hypothetical protein
MISLASIFWSSYALTLAVLLSHWVVAALVVPFGHIPADCHIHHLHLVALTIHALIHAAGDS